MPSILPAAGAGTRAICASAACKVTAIDIDTSGLADLADDPLVEIAEIDLERPGAEPLAGRRFGAVVVTDYLFRPLLVPLVDCLLPGGVFLYETFGVGNERFGRPRNPDYLLQRGELLALAEGRLSVLAYEHRISPAAQSQDRSAPLRPEVILGR